MYVKILDQIVPWKIKNKRNVVINNLFIFSTSIFYTNFNQNEYIVLYSDRCLIYIELFSGFDKPEEREVKMFVNRR